MHRHVTLRRRNFAGRKSWVLLGPDGQPLDAFSIFAESLRNDPDNTLETYCRHLAEFVDYLFEAIILLGFGPAPTKRQLSEVLEAYGDYLLYGVDASHPIAQAVAAELPPGKNSPGTVDGKKAALRRFLRLSEEARKELTELSALSLSNIVVHSDPLLPELGKTRQLTRYEISAMQANSMLSGVLAGGPKLIEAIPLGRGSPQVHYDERRAFPYDKVLDLIDAAPTFRDATLYGLLASSAARTHEGTQILLTDIDVERGTLRLVDPKLRPGHLSYRYLTAEQRQLLAWKGRTTDLTLLIEPFATAFFESLHKYLEREYIAHGMHDFLFQYSRSSEFRGLPWFLSGADSRLSTFHSTCKRIGVQLPRKSGLHSLRHMNATYLVNYFPRSDGGYGLPITTVQQLLGHSDVKQTLKYARIDKDLHELEIQNANHVLFSFGAPKTILQLKADALEAQLMKVRLEMAAEEHHD